MCGGSAEAFAAAEPVMQAYAARMVHIGGPGAGQTTKMVNQIAIAGVVQGLSEALRFAQASKLDTDKIFEAVSGGAAASWPTQIGSASGRERMCTTVQFRWPPDHYKK